MDTLLLLAKLGHGGEPSDYNMTVMCNGGERIRRVRSPSRWNRVGIESFLANYINHSLPSVHRVSILYPMYGIVCILVPVRPSNDIRSWQDPPKGNAGPQTTIDPFTLIIGSSFRYPILPNVLDAVRPSIPCVSLQDNNGQRWQPD